MMRDGHGAGIVPSEKGRRSSDAWWAEERGVVPSSCPNRTIYEVGHLSLTVGKARGGDATNGRGSMQEQCEARGDQKVVVAE